jgi:hypothetical protein
MAGPPCGSSGAVIEVHGISPEARIMRQVHAPDRHSRDAALLRTRWYRFSDDSRHYVLAEALEERLAAGHRLRPATRDYVSASLTAIRTLGRPLPFRHDIAEAEGIDVAAELAARSPYAWHRVRTSGDPRAVVIIVGAPRSGTSHLFNLLARSGSFGYFTTASCWAWPVRNLHHPARHLFTAFGDAVLAVDNKRTRVIPGLVMPGEAEDIWARAIPTYRHVAAHRYEVIPPQAAAPGILEAAARAHSNFFAIPRLLTKSPFSSFRIPQTEKLWGQSVRYIHILRDRRDVAASLERNHFEFVHHGQLLTSSQAWLMFTAAVREHAPPSRLMTVIYRDLRSEPTHLIERILTWLQVTPPSPEARMNGHPAASGNRTGLCPANRSKERSG